MITKNVLPVLGAALLASGCGSSDGVARDTSESNLASAADTICSRFAYDPSAEHLVYRACATPSTVIVNLQTGASTTVSAVPGSYLAYITSDAGFIVRTSDRAELFDWNGVSKAVLADPQLDPLHPDDPATSFVVTESGTSLVAWRLETRIESGVAWQLRVFRSASDGTTGGFLTAPSPTTEPITDVLADPAGGHLVLRVRSGQAFRLGTAPGSALVSIAPAIGRPIPSSYDGHGVLTYGAGDAVLPPGRLFHTNLDSGAAQPVSVNEIAVRTISTVGSYSTRPRRESVVVDGSTVYFAESHDNHYRIGRWDRSHPELGVIQLATGDGHVVDTATSNKDAAEGFPAQPLRLSPDKQYVVYVVSAFAGEDDLYETASHSAPHLVKAVRAGGPTPEVNVGRVSGFADAHGFFTFGGTSTIAFPSGNDTATVADLSTGTTRSITSAGATLLSRDGSVVYGDVALVEGSRFKGSKVLAGTPGPGLSVAYTSRFDVGFNSDTIVRSRMPIGNGDLAVIEMTQTDRWQLVRVHP